VTDLLHPPTSLGAERWGRIAVCATGAATAVWAQPQLADAAALAVSAPVLVAVGAQRSSSLPDVRMALAAAVGTVLVMVLVVPAAGVATVLGAGVAGTVFVLLHRFAPLGSSPAPILVAIVVGGLAGPFGAAWSVLALGVGLLVNGAVAAVVLLVDDRPGRTTPMTAVLVLCALGMALARGAWPG
jgi:hypothetical protein